MRITGGKLRNRNISMHSPKGIRPTASRVREALFSMIGQDLTGIRFLDAFGGSGIVGVEAFSRGAEVMICENRRGAFLAIKNLLIQESWSIKLTLGSAERALKQKWDVVFMDPPYEYDPLPWLKMIEPDFTGQLIFEHSSKKTIPNHVGVLIRTKTKAYGECSLTFFRSSLAAQQNPLFY